MESQTGKAFGSYHLEELVGEGGFSQVFRAHPEHLPNTKVAVKIAKNEGDKGQNSRIWLEAEALDSLEENEHIVRLIDYQPNTATPYLVLEFCDSSLQRKLDETKKLPWQEAVSITRQILEGLKAVHANPKVRYHGDLKPSNILFKKGVVKIADFGAQTGKREFSDSVAHAGTIARDVGGLETWTKAYHTPEQLFEGRVTPKTDIHQVGQILYEMVSGVNFRQTEGRDSPSNHGAPKWIDDFVMNATNPAQESRPDVKKSLEHLEEGLRGKFDKPKFRERIKNAGRRIDSAVDSVIGLGKGVGKLGLGFGKGVLKYGTCPIWGPYWMFVEGCRDSYKKRDGEWVDRTEGEKAGLVLGGLALIAGQTIGAYNTYEYSRERKSLTEARTALKKFDGSLAVLWDNQISIFPSDSFLDSGEPQFSGKLQVPAHRAIGLQGSDLFYINKNHSEEIFRYNLETGETTRITDCFDERNREFFGKNIEEAGLASRENGYDIVGRIGKKWYGVNDGAFEQLEEKQKNLELPSKKIPGTNLELEPGYTGMNAPNCIDLNRTDSWWGEKTLPVPCGNDFFLTNYKHRGR